MLFAAAFALLPLLASAAPAPAPTGIQRRATGATISLQRDASQCLTVVQQQTGVFSNGLTVTTLPCSGSRLGPQLWDISPGDGLVRVTGTNYCLDAGTNPSNNGALKIWQCYPGLTQQQWYLTNDNRIAITGGNQCLDQGPANTQTYQCITGNNNQGWIVGGGGPPPASSSSSASASSSVAPPPTPSGVRIHPNGDTTQCFALAARFPGVHSGTLVGITPCAYVGYEEIMRWDISRGDGKIRLHGYNFCLDAGVPPQDGVLAKIWECQDGNPVQQWFYTDDNRIALTGGNQCLDRKTENPFLAQTWQCSTGNTNQVWTTTA